VLRASISVLFLYHLYDCLSLGIMRILVSTSKFPATRNKLQGSKSSSCDAPPPELGLPPPAQGGWPLPSAGRLHTALRCCQKAAPNKHNRSHLSLFFIPSPSNAPWPKLTELTAIPVPTQSGAVSPLPDTSTRNS